MRRWIAPALAVALLSLLVAPSIAATSRQGQDAAAVRHRLPLVIGHRGSAGYRPEHTIASYQLAIEMGADFIEPDLVSTKDHVLVARHENDISATTDVSSHPEFANRRVTKTIDGLPITGWFTEDFTLAELRTLRAKERLPDVRPDNTAFDGTQVIPTFREVIDLAKRSGVGIYPETKHPTYFRGIGLPLEEPLVETLRATGLDRRNAPVFIQSFEVGNLKRLHGMTGVPLVQLVDANRLQAPTTLVGDAHRAGLVVHPWTFRNENTFLPADFQQGNPASAVFPRAIGDSPAEYRLFFGLGVDGLFSDDPDTAVASRTEVFGKS
jgi:glycerophosphoryl diester phosphodiesterase